ncbi:MAG: hypothetical protein V2A74_12200, partial [bacterium]
AIKVSPVCVAIYIALLNTALLAVVWWFTRSFFGSTVALWTTFLYAVFPLEIIQLRFYWNPCFLPLVVTGAMIGLLQVAVRRKAWHFVTVVLFICLGIQLHLSAVMMIPGVVIVLLAARVRIPVRVWVTALILTLILFSPLIVSELTTDKSNLVQVLTSPDTHRGSLERFEFNPNGLTNFFHHVRLQMYERGEAVGFTYLQTMPLIGDHWLGRGRMLIAKTINAFGQIELLFWGLGIAICVREIYRFARASKPKPVGADKNARNRMLLCLTLLVWQLVPIFFLSFFNFHGQPSEPPSVVSLRYYLVTYPAVFITTALGLTGLILWVKNGREIFSLRRLQWVVPAVGIVLVALHFTFDLLYLQMIERSGRWIPYNFPNLAPNMRTMLKVREILLGQARIDREAWFKRVHTQQLGDYYFGEATFDWLITQDPRSMTNLSPDPHLRWLLHSPFEDARTSSLAPKIPEGAQEIRRWTIDETGISILEYRVDDPQQPVPDNSRMRNYYYKDNPMRYLGPGASFREGRGGEKQ